MSIRYRQTVQEHRRKNSTVKRLMCGVTLIELMVSLAIMGIVMALAAPSFQETISNNRRVAAANQLVATLTFVWSEAVKRGIQVTIRRKSATPDVSGVWENGWDVFADINGDGTMNGADTILKTYDALPLGYTLRTVGTNWVAYRGSGFSVGSETFRLCDSSANTVNSRTITINTVGRANVTKGTASCP